MAPTTRSKTLRNCGPMCASSTSRKTPLRREPVRLGWGREQSCAEVEVEVGPESEVGAASRAGASRRPVLAAYVQKKKAKWVRPDPVVRHRAYLEAGVARTMSSGWNLDRAGGGWAFINDYRRRRVHEEEEAAVPMPQSFQRAHPEDQDEMALMRIKLRNRLQMKWSEERHGGNCLISWDKTIAHFHPENSEGTVACRTVEPLRRDPKRARYYYWELLVLDKTYGTSVMFGLCTKRQCLHSTNYCNLIGSDGEGWSMSHKGLIWHSGSERPYTSHFPIGQPVRVGLLYDTERGQLSYLMNGRNLGVAFIGLKEIQEDLYPCVGSTAKNTIVVILGAYYGSDTLLDRSFVQLFKMMHKGEKQQQYSERSQSITRLADYLEYNRLPPNLLSHFKTLAERYIEGTVDHKDQQKQHHQRANEIPKSVLDSWRFFHHELKQQYSPEHSQEPM